MQMKVQGLEPPDPKNVARHPGGDERLPPGWGGGGRSSDFQQKIWVFPKIGVPQNG